MIVINDKLKNDDHNQSIFINNRLIDYNSLTEENKTIFNNFLNFIKEYKNVKIENYTNGMIVLTSNNLICTTDSINLDYNNLSENEKNIISDVITIMN